MKRHNTVEYKRNQVCVDQCLRQLCITTYLSLGFSTYFWKFLTTLRVCSANSLDGSMIRALGALEEAFTWLTLALPAQEEQGQILNKGIDQCRHFGGDSKKMSNKILFFQMVSDTFNANICVCVCCPQTCLRGFDGVTLRCLIQGNEPTFWGVFEALSSKVELKLCILAQDKRRHFYSV